MAKMYYNLEEATARLGCNEEQLRGFVRAGKLREFRDAGKLNYRVDEVEAIASSSGDNLTLSAEDSGELTLAADDSGEQSTTPVLGGSTGGFVLEEAEAPIDLGGSDTSLPTMKSGSGSGTGITLSDSDTETAPKKEPPKSGSGAGADILRLDEVDKEVSQGMRKDDTVITNIGISVFDDDDLEIAADPRAKTLMTGADEHLGLDGSGGGSGLLDLTRESDDTSLGAELLDGIDMGDTAETVIPGGTATATEPVQEEEPLPEAAPVAVAPVGQTMVVPSAPPYSPAFTGLLAAAVITLGLAGAATIANSMNAWPAYLGMLAEQFWIFLAGTLALGGLGALVGYFVGKQPSGPRPPKPAKEKAPKKEKARKG